MLDLAGYIRLLLTRRR